MEKISKMREEIMRLYNIFFLCKLYYPQIDKLQVEEIRNSNGSNGYFILNWNEGKKAIEELGKISCLSELARQVYNSINSLDRDKLRPDISAHTQATFTQNLINLKVGVMAMLELCESLQLDESKSGIDVKIPKSESLKEYMNYLKEIDFIFTQCPYLICKDEEIKFNTVDVGSQWLTFFVIASGSFYILNNLAKLVEKAIAIKSHLKTLTQQDEMLKSMEMKNEATKEAVSIFNTMKQTVMSGYVEELESKLGKLKDGEERSKVEFTLEKLCLLIDKGVEIYSSIETPNEVKAMFPMNENNPILPDNIIKLLEKKEEE